MSTSLRIPSSHAPVAAPALACLLLVALLALLAATAAGASVPPVPPRALGGAPAALTPDTPTSRAAPSALFPSMPDVQVNVDPGNLVNESGPAVATSPGGVIHAVWNGDESQQTIWYAHSTDGGQTYSTPVRLNDAVAYPPSFSVYQPDIAVGPDGTVYAVWFDYRGWTSDFDYGGRIDCYLDRSTDGGLTWGTDVMVSGGGSGTYPWHFQPYLAVDPSDGDVLVSFTDYDRYLPEGDPSDISLARSTDGGASFGPKVRVDGLPALTLVAQTWSSIAVGPAGDVYVAFEDARGTSRDIRVAHAADDAPAFDSDVLVQSDTTGAQLSPDIEVDLAGRVHVTWIDRSLDPDPLTAPFESHVRYARSTDPGATFGPAVTVTDALMGADGNFDWPPRLAVDRAGTVHVVWFDTRIDTTFCYWDRSADGLAFGTDEVLHTDRGGNTHALPRIAMLGDDDPCVMWVDRRNGTFFDVFATRRKEVAAVGGLPGAGGARLAVHPNPARGASWVRFALENSGPGRIEVRDVQGRRVRTLVAGVLSTGVHEVAWDGTDESGRRVAAGAYWIRLEADGARVAMRAVRLR